MELLCVLNMLHLITNTAVCLQLWHLYSQKEDCGSVLNFIMVQKCTILSWCCIKMIKMETC